LALLLILCVAKIKSLPSQQLLLSQSRQYLPNTKRPTTPARDGPRQKRQQNDPNHTQLSSDIVYLTTQA
jgi:hypothetical protein